MYHAKALAYRDNVLFRVTKRPHARKVVSLVTFPLRQAESGILPQGYPHLLWISEKSSPSWYLRATRSTASPLRVARLLNQVARRSHSLRHLGLHHPSYAEGQREPRVKPLREPWRVATRSPSPMSAPVAASCPYV